MNKEILNRERKKLVKKYFWEQKVEELSKFLFYAMIFSFVVGLSVQIGWICELVPDQGNITICKIPYEPVMPYWVMITGLFIIGLNLIYFFISWIFNNLEEAERRADEKLGIKNKQNTIFYY